MQFSDTSTKQGIIQACERYCNKGDAGISGTASLLAEFVAHCNFALRQAWFLIFRASGIWFYDDSNYTDLPQATTNLVSGTSKYALISEALTIERVEIMDSTGQWSVLTQRPLHTIGTAIDEHFESDGTPQEYRLLNNSIELFPAPNYNSTNGLKLYFTRSSVSFVAADTTKTPGFASEFHDFVPVVASLEWLIIRKPNDSSIPQLREHKKEISESMVNFYQRRNKNYQPVLQVKAVNYK